MKVVVTGGRDFKDRDFVYATLNHINRADRHGPLFPPPFPQSRLTHVIHGGAKGADTLAGEWARENGIQEVVCIANWGKFDKPAGAIRNSWMLDLLDPFVDCLVLFPGGKGTQNCVTRAVELGLKVYRYYGPREYEDLAHNMLRIARGEIEEQEAPEEAQPNGEAIPEPDAPVRAVPGDVGNGVFNLGALLGGGGGGGQAQEANQGRLHPADPLGQLYGHGNV